MNNNYNIRMATPGDAPGMLAVYGPYVETTANTFEYEVPSVEDFTGRVQAVIPDFPWLVCEHDGVIIGYACAHKHRERAAYQWSPESTVYIAQAYHGKGIARILYETLFAMLRLQGFVNVYAGVLATNISSTRFHKAFGFEEIGVFKNIGYKLGEWHSNLWYQFHLVEHPIAPAIPKKMLEITGTDEYNSILMHANVQLAARHALVS